MSRGVKKTTVKSQTNKLHGPFLLPPGIEAKICVNYDVVHVVPHGYARLAHVAYTLTQADGSPRWRSVDYFVDTKAGLNLPPSSYPVDLVLEAKAGVCLEILKRFAGDTDAIRGLVAAHIRDHLGSRYKPDTQPDLETSVKTVKGVKPRAPGVVGTVELKLASKKHFKGICGYVIQAELSRGCPAAITPNWCATPRTGCAYCYDHLLEKYGACETLFFDPVKATQQLRRLRKKLKVDEKTPLTMCIGVNADPGHTIYRTELYQVLHFCVDNGLVPVIRSKFLVYDVNLSAFLISTNGVLVVSLGNDDLEPGTVAHGRTQAVRIADGLRYLKDGVNVVAGVVMDPAQKNGGPLFEMTLKVAVDTFPRVICYALRAKSQEIGRQLFGDDFETRKAPDGSPAYRYEGSQYIAAYIHPTVQKLIGANDGKVRLCLKSSAGTWCGGCHVPGKRGVVLKGLRKASNGTRAIAGFEAKGGGR